MNQQLKPGLSPAEVAELYGEPDIEEKIDDTTEVWSYAKHANSDDAFAQLFYTSAKEGDRGTFEDLKFIDGSLVSWGEGQHTMAGKESSPITTSFKGGRSGGRHGGSQSGGQFGSPASSGSLHSSESSDSEVPFSSSH